MSRPTEVLVKVEDLDEIRKTYRRTVTPSMGIARADAAFQRVFDTIPEPEWEPSEEQIVAFNDGAHKVHCHYARPSVILILKSAHEAGLLP